MTKYYYLSIYFLYVYEFIMIITGKGSFIELPFNSKNNFYIMHFVINEMINWSFLLKSQ